MFGECHMHIFMNGVDYPKAVADMKNGLMEEVVRRNLEAYQRKGITFLRDGGDHFGASLLARALAPEYGITYRTPLYGIHKKGYYGSVVGYAYETPEEFVKLAEHAAENGADFIKIMISGIMDFDREGALTCPSLEAEEIWFMIRTAHACGLSVMAHTNGPEAVKAAVSAGVDSLEHGNFMDEECIHLLAESDTIYVPTLVTVRNLIGDGRFPDKALKNLWKRQCDVIRSCYEAGVQMALGSDAGAYCVLHGQGLLDEYQAFCDILGKSEELDRHLQIGEYLIRERFQPGAYIVS